MHSEPAARMYIAGLTPPIFDICLNNYFFQIQVRIWNKIMKIHAMNAGKKDLHNFSARTNTKTSLQRFSETVESKFSILVKTPKLFEKCKYDEQEQVIASTSSKRARASAEDPPRRFRTRPTNRTRGIKSPSDDENSSATRPLGRSDEEDSQEECIIPDQQNLAEEIRKI